MASFWRGEVTIVVTSVVTSVYLPFLHGELLAGEVAMVAR